jgi:Tol biopolymer transport system component
VPILGGASTPRELLRDIDTPVAFSPDGTRIAYVTSNEIAGQSALMIANADGSGARALASRTRPNEFSWVAAGPAWVPDGGSIISAGISSDDHGRYGSLVEVRVADGSQRHLGSRRFAEVGRLGWLADGSGFLVAASDRLGENQLWHVSYPRGDARQITNDQSKNYRGLSVTADSSLLATVQRDQHTTLWLSENGELTRARQISVGKYDGRFGLTWAPDRRVVYHSMESGNEDIWLMNADGSGRKQLTLDPGVDERPVVAPDGRQIVFASNRAGDFHIWRVDIDGGNEKQLTRGINDVSPDVTSDGRWVVYSSSSTGKPTLWKVPLEGGQPVQLTEVSSTHPAVSPDGTLVAFRYRSDPNTDGAVAVVRVSDGQGMKVLDGAEGVPAREFQWTAEGITYVRTSGGISNIWSQPPDGGPARQLTHFDSGRIVRYRWSPDGRSLVIARGTINNDVVLIRNIAGHR